MMKCARATTKNENDEMNVMMMMCVVFMFEVEKLCVEVENVRLKVEFEDVVSDVVKCVCVVERVERRVVERDVTIRAFE